MVDLLLQTKLYVPPIRPSLVSRPQLINKLNESLQGKLTLVAAPAGFGKTTLVAAWIGEQQAVAELPIAWLSLDEGDNDLPRFLRYLMAAVQQADGRLGQTALTMLQTHTDANANLPVQALLTSLVNDLAAASSLVVVLDDYHFISETAVHDSLAFLLDHLPSQSHIIITSRTDPPLPLARLRVRHQLNEIRAEDLKFTGEETAVFLNRIMGLNLTSQDIVALEARTEGWAAGLQLAALSLQGQPDPHAFVQAFTGDDRQIVDYLMAEVLGRQPKYVQDFLLATAVLDRLNVRLCNAVTGQVGSQQILENLDQANLFIVPLDNRRGWYRYHHLFADFLRARLQQDDAQRIPQLHHRAADWYERNGFIDEAIEHALAASDLDRAAALIDEVVPNVLWQKGQLMTILRWLDKLPGGSRQAHPRLAVVHCWALFAARRWQVLDEHLDEVEGRLSTLAAEDEERQGLQGQILAMRAEIALFRGDLDEATRLFNEAMALLPELDMMSRVTVTQAQGYIYRLNGRVAAAEAVLQQAREYAQQRGSIIGRVSVLNDLAEVRLIEGRLTAADKLFEEIVTGLTVEPEAVPVACSAFLGLGRVALARWQLDTAVSHLQRGIHISQLGGYTGFTRQGYLSLAQVQLAQGDESAAWATLQQAIVIAQQEGIAWVMNQTALIQAQLLLAQGQSVADWVREVQTGERPFAPRYQQHTEQVTLAHALLEQGEVAESLALLMRLRETAVSRQWFASLIDIDLLLALGCQRQNDTPAAQSHLHNALVRAKVENNYYPFTNKGAAVATLLATAKSSPFIQKLQQILPPVPQPPRSPTLPEPLTDRETEILHLLATGLSNREIATKLFVAVGTVGKHTSNIFAKLDAPNRATAVLRAQELGLL